MKLIRVGVDLAKNVFQVHGVERNEQAVWRRKLARESWLKVLLETVEPGCEIGMESCGGAHHWARRLQARGFAVRLIAPQFVAPMGRVSEDGGEQDIQAVHLIRAELSKQRTAKGNQIRGLVAEYGLVAPKELLHLRRALPCWVEDAENGLSERFRRLLNGLWGDLLALDEREGNRGEREEIGGKAEEEVVGRGMEQGRAGGGGERGSSWRKGGRVGSGR